MTNKARNQRENQSGSAVKSGIHRAAKRIGLDPAVTAAEELDRTDEELDVLRHLADVAEQIFEHQGVGGNDPAHVLTEALHSAADDFSLIAEAQGHASAPVMMFRRAELRCQLALALFEYRQEFGYVGTAGGAS